MSTPAEPAAKRPSKHHYIPQFLLRRFALPGNTDQLVRVLTRDGVLPQESVANVAFVRDFYPPCGVFSDPEGKLSQEENSYAYALREWSDQRQLTEKAGEKAGDFAWHLRLRSKTFRTHGEEIVAAIKLGMASGIGKVVQASQPTSTLQQDLRKLFAVPAREDEAAQLAKVLTDHLHAWCLTTAYGLRLDPSVQQFAHMLIPHIHTTLLMRQVVNKAEKDKQRRWRVEPVKDDLLLGDCGPIVLPKDAKTLEHYFMAGPEASIFLPIASDRLLIGSSSLDSPVPTVAQLNRGTLELSGELVVGRWTVDKFKQNAKYLGRRAAAAIDVVEIVQQTSNAFEQIAQGTRGAVEYFISKNLGLNPRPFEPPDLIPTGADHADTQLAAALVEGVVSANRASKALTPKPDPKEKSGTVTITVRRKTRPLGKTKPR